MKIKEYLQYRRIYVTYETDYLLGSCVTCKSSNQKIINCREVCNNSYIRNYSSLKFKIFLKNKVIRLSEL